MLLLKLLAIILLFGFIAISVYKFGIPESYSILAYKWKKPTWTVVTILTAFLMLPVLLETLITNLQFLCFLMPVWLIVIAFTPDFLDNKIQYIIHMTFTGLCVIANLIWMFSTNYWIIGLLASILVLIAGLITKTWKSSYVFWLEIIIFTTCLA